MHPIILWIVAATILTVGDLLLKKWINGDGPSFYVLGMVLYLISSNILIYTFRVRDIAVASTIYVVFNVITLALASWWLFDEKLSPMKIAGIITALVSISLLELG